MNVTRTEVTETDVREMDVTSVDTKENQNSYVQRKSSAISEEADDEFVDTDLEDGEDAETTANFTSDCESLGYFATAYKNCCSRHSSTPCLPALRNLDLCTKLALRYLSLNDVDMKCLAAGLQCNYRLRYLQLKGNAITGAGLENLKDVLLQYSVISYLDISDNDLRTSGAKVVGELIDNSNLIEYLLIAGNHFVDGDAAYIGTALADNNVLVQLDVSHNLFSTQAGVSFGKAIACNSRLKSLNLSWNDITLDGAVAICKGLQQNDTLEEINLGWNGFAYSGGLATEELLKVNTPLICLDLSNNRLNWDAAKFIADGLGKNSVLRTLKLDMNPLTTTGCLDIITAIQDNNTTLEYLSLKEIPVTEEFELLAAMIQQSRGFNYVHGVVVESPDVLGQRSGRKKEAISKLICCIQERRLRAVEIFHMLDKTRASRVATGSFADWLLGSGTSLPAHERQELTDFIESMKLEKETKFSRNVNYKEMMNGFQQHIERERQEKIREREQRLQRSRYHQRILSVDLSAIDQDDLQRLTLKAQAKLHSGSSTSRPNHNGGIQDSLASSRIDENPTSFTDRDPVKYSRRPDRISMVRNISMPVLSRNETPSLSTRKIKRTAKS